MINSVFHIEDRDIFWHTMEIWLPITTNILPCSSASENNDQGVVSHDDPVW